MARLSYRTVWISDTHLGSRGSEAGKLAWFLKHVRCERLYLVGDVVDFWRLGSKGYWPASHNDVLRRLLKILKRGTEVVIVPGNHDEALRQYDGIEFGGLSIRLHDVHECADGRRLFVTHGDQYDLVVRHSRMLSLVGSLAYEWLLVANRLNNRYRQFRGKPHFSLAQAIKLKVKSACTFVSRFQETLAREARSRGLDGVVCGHIHHPEITRRDGFTYYNCGDWIENCTALVEDETGAIRLVRADELRRRKVEAHDDDEADEFTLDPVIIASVVATPAGGRLARLTNGKHSERVTFS